MCIISRLSWSISMEKFPFVMCSREHHAWAAKNDTNWYLHMDRIVACTEAPKTLPLIDATKLMRTNCYSCTISDRVTLTAGPSVRRRHIGRATASVTAHRLMIYPLRCSPSSLSIFTFSHSVRLAFRCAAHVWMGPCVLWNRSRCREEVPPKQKRENRLSWEIINKRLSGWIMTLMRCHCCYLLLILLLTVARC